MASDSEESEEVDTICIEDGERKEDFSVEDANNPEKVKAKFGLDYEPACVFKGNTASKRIAFGNLSSSGTYKLSGACKIPDQNQHVQNAVMMSNAIYQPDPSKYVQTTSANHTIHTIHGVSKFSQQGVMVVEGVVNNKRTLYVTSRGTTTWEDAMADANNAMKTKDTIPGGKFHSGFNTRARSSQPFQNIFPITDIATYRLNQLRGQCSENHLKCITRWKGRDGVTITIFFQRTRDGHETSYL